LKLSRSKLTLTFRGVQLKQAYIPDVVCFDSILVELKAARELAPEHRSQMLNYLKATGLRLGLRVNFGCAPKARIERFAN
jgi:GxxExxY protein